MFNSPLLIIATINAAYAKTTCKRSCPNSVNKRTDDAVHSIRILFVLYFGNSLAEVHYYTPIYAPSVNDALHGHLLLAGNGTVPNLV